MIGVGNCVSFFRPSHLALILHISFFTIFLCETISKADALLSDKYLSAEGNYYIHFLSKAEMESVSVQKCCPNGKVLDGEGNCITFADSSKSAPAQWGAGTDLDIRIRRVIEDKRGNGSEDAVPFKLRHPHCLNRLKQLPYPGNSSSSDLSFTKSLELVARTDDSTHPSFLIINPNDYCIDWSPSLDTIAVQYCVPETCHSMIGKDDSLSSISSLDPDRKQLDPDPIQMHHNGTPLESSISPLCLRKCCPPNQVINMTSFQCVNYDLPYQLHPMSMTRNKRPPAADPSMNLPSDDEARSHPIPLALTWLTGLPPNCEHYEVYSDKYDRYYINSDGVLVTVQNSTVSETPPGEYCFEGVALEDGEEANKPTIISRQMAIVCFEEKDYEGAEGEGVGMENAEAHSWRQVYTVLTGISCLFLFITCLVYGILWKDLNLPGWLQFAYALSLLLTFTLLTVAQLWTQQIHDISKGLCRALGYGLHFFFLSCFFWLTSMNLDLWLSFRNTVLVGGFGKSRGKRRFSEFTAFSIGFPAAITLLLLAADNCCPDDTGAKGTFCILPSTGIGEESCVVDTRHKVAQLHYFYGFVGVLLLINLVIFVCTLISLRNRERETRIAKRQSTSKCDYDRLQLFTRLFLIMGILWIFEVIAWTFEYFYGEENVHQIFIFTDCLNASQGVAVFLMFVWKKQTWKQLKKKFKSVTGVRGKRQLSRPRYTYTVSSGTNTNDTSVKSSHLSSTKSSDSSQVPSTSTTISQFEFDH